MIDNYLNLKLTILLKDTDLLFYFLLTWIF